jgi:glycine cleavage system aminomethyltransferase T
VELSDRILTVRRSVAISRLDHVRYVRLLGEGAYELLRRVFTRELFVRDGQLVHGLFLDEDGRVFADCTLASDADDFFLLAEGPDQHALETYLRGHGVGIDGYEIIDGSETHGLIGLDGPYAWELMARLVGQEIIGLPYLTFFHLDGAICCRSGKTGEYGYTLIVELDQMDEVRAELEELGQALDMTEGGLDALDVCALENWFFNIRGEGQAGLTPLELQLQWRVSRKKDYVGSVALRRQVEQGIQRRLTTVTSEGELTVGAPVFLDGRAIGVVVNAAHSPVRGDWVALALLDRGYAHPDVTGLRVGEGAVPARSVSPPVLVNRSLYVNPQVHSYETREQDDFPPLVAT